MHRQSLIDKIIDARVLVDKALADAYQLRDRDKRQRDIIFWTEHALDDLDFVLNLINTFKGDDSRD